MLVARILAVSIAIVLAGLVLAYVLTSDRRYLRLAVKLGTSVAVAAFVFFAVLAYQNWA